MRNLYNGPSKDASYQVSVHLVKRLQGRYFRNQPIRNKNCLWRPCLLSDRNYMSTLYKGPSNDASYQISIHLAKRLPRRRFFRNRPIRNKDCLWRPCLLNRSEYMSNLYRWSSNDASYHVSIHLAKWFQRRRFFWNRPIRNKNWLLRPCLLTDRN
jgi:hypothetical protein